MKNILFVMTIALCFSACNKPEKYAVYQSLLYDNIKVQVLYVGKNWEIKDAVNSKELEDAGYFHGKEFWSYKTNEQLVVVSSKSVIFAISLERFNKEFRLIKK